MKLRILAISDIHERTMPLYFLGKRLGERPDIVIAAGDLTHFKPIGYAVHVLKAISEALAADVLFVPGNCDPPELLKAEPEGLRARNIHGKAVELGGLYFYGIGGSGFTPFDTLIEFNENSLRDLVKGAEGYPPEKLVMVTHQPILGFFDYVRGDRVGSAAYREFLEEKAPLLWITGHIHEHSGISRHGRTTIVHPGPFNRGFYAIIEIDGEDVRATIDRIK